MLCINVRLGLELLQLYIYIYMILFMQTCK